MLSLAKKHSRLMGPEEIHIYFWEGAPRPPKRKCDRPKNLEVFLVNFQIRYLSLVVVVLVVAVVVVFPMWWGVGCMDQLKLKSYFFLYFFK